MKATDEYSHSFFSMYFEEYSRLLSARGVAYLNVDMAVDGKTKTSDINYFLREVFNFSICLLFISKLRGFITS